MSEWQYGKRHKHNFKSQNVYFHFSLKTFNKFENLSHIFSSFCKNQELSRRYRCMDLIKFGLYLETSNSSTRKKLFIIDDTYHSKTLNLRVLASRLCQHFQSLSSIDRKPEDFALFEDIVFEKRKSFVRFVLISKIVWPFPFALLVPKV